MFDLNLIPDTLILTVFYPGFVPDLSSFLDSVPDLNCVPSLDCDPDPYSDSAPDLLLLLILILLLVISF